MMHRGVRQKASKSSRFRKFTTAFERASKRAIIQPCRSIVEVLEERRLLSSSVVINEFMADNNSGFSDPAFSGAHPDWIELYNRSNSAVNLQGWMLKDGPGLTTWTFPAGATIAANGYLVVAADSKNLTNPAAIMHTNFSLSKDGEYLGLFDPTNTVANEFSPYPAQSSDISYGIIQQSDTLPIVGPTANEKATVPTDGSLDAASPDWRSDTYDDSGAQWLSGKGGVGFDPNPGGGTFPAGWNVHMIDTSTGDFPNIATAKKVLDGNTTGFTVFSDTNATQVPNIDFMEGGHFTVNRDLPNGASVGSGASSALRTEYALRASALVTIPAGTYTIGVNSNEGFQLTIPGVTFSSRLNESYTSSTSNSDQITWGGTRTSGDTLGTFTVASQLNTTINVDMFEQIGADNLEVFIASGIKSSVDGSFALLGNGTFGWSLSSAPANVPFTGLFGLDLQTPMLNNNSSAYVRIPFNVDPDDLSAFQGLLLHVKYDDGFVAWINGQQIASANAPASLAFNSAATAAHQDPQAVVYQDFTIPNPQNFIHAGVNVLAIQGMNVSPTDDDFLNLTTLDGITGSVDVPRFFAPSTPKAANTGALIGKVADTKFDHDRGFYSTPFSLVLSSADTVNGATIRYTTDGSTPTLSNGITYTAPITINKTSTIRAAAFRNGYLSTDVDTQTYIFLTDVITQSASNTNTGTPPPGWPANWSPNTTDYGMDPDVVNNPLYGATIKNDLQTIPTLSIVTELSNLFGGSGLYSNPSMSGIAWERPASLELINPDGSTGFQINAGLRLRGGFSRDTSNPKHGLRVLLRDKYGSGTLNYPLFKSMDGTDATRGFDLRTFENYSWSFQGDGANFIGLRDQFSRDTQFAMGHNAERGDMYNLYIDGQYWGIYNTDERPEADNAVSYYGGTTDDYDTIKVDPQLNYTINATDGNTAGWNAFWNMTNQVHTMADSGQDTSALYQKMQGNNPDGTRNPAYPVYLDANDLIDYLLVAYFGGNLDAPISNFLGNTSPNNFYAVWNHTTKNMGFQYFAHDSEHTLLDVNANRLGPYPAGMPGVSDFTKSNPQEMFQQLLYNPDFRMLVADRIHKFFFNNGVLTPAQNIARFNARRDEINRAIVGESARWGDAKTGAAFTYAGNWEPAIANVTNNFFPQRTNNMITQFKTQNMGDGTVNFTMYPSLAALAAPEFIEQFGGTIAPGFVAHLTVPAGATVYYTLDGSDPRLPGGAISPKALVYNAASGILLNASTHLIVRGQTLVNNVPSWSASTDATFTLATPPGVRVSEIMYHPVDTPAGSIYSGKDTEYIEVQNITASPINLKNYSFTHGVSFTFPDMLLAPGARTVVVANLAAFQGLYGNALPVAGVYSGNLDNNGEKVTFNGPLGEVIQSFSYSDSWYPQSDGTGFSLVARDTNQAVGLYDSKQGWRASNGLGGDPDAFAAALNPGSVVINEVGAKVASPGSSFIELANTTNSPIDISGWFLSNDSGGVDPLDPSINLKPNLKKYQFPAGTIIAANGYLLLNEQSSYNQAGNPAALVPFTLDGDGADTITLSQADGSGNLLGYREIQDYGAADVGQTLGRYVKSDGATDFVIQKTATPGAANAGPATPAVIINEVMYAPTVRYAGSSIYFPNPNLEYIELRNTTSSPVQLFDPAHPSNTWRLADGVDFAFPANATIPANGYVVISNLLPNDFRTVYNSAYGANSLPVSVTVYGPMHGFLDNNGEKISLQRPGVQNGLILPYINVDRLSYDNKAPWPTSPDQTGPSLIRKSPLLYGNDPSNWTSSTQTALNGQLIGSPGVKNLPPAALSNAFIYQSGPRKISVTFSEDVSASLQASDLVVHNNTTGLDLPAVQISVAWDPATYTATWTLGTLADGNYHATLAAAGVTDSGNTQLAASSTLDFFFLNGDANRDRSVGFADLVAVAQHYGQVSGGTFAGGDLNGDGGVGFADLVAVAQGYGKSLPAAADVPGDPAAAAASGAVSAQSQLAAAMANPALTPSIKSMITTLAGQSATPPAPPVTAKPKPVVVTKPVTVTKPVVVTKPVTKPVSKPEVVTKPVTLSKSKLATPLAPVATFSTTRIGSDTKKKNDLLN